MLENYEEEQTNDAGVKADVMVAIRQLLEGKLKDQWDIMIRKIMPTVCNLTVGNLIKQYENADAITLPDDEAVKTLIIAELKSINNRVSAAAHVRGQEEARHTSDDIVEKMDSKVLCKLIDQTYELINNKIPQLRYVLTQNTTKSKRRSKQAKPRDSQKREKEKGKAMDAIGDEDGEEGYFGNIF
ncbi:unnamed protein product [Adineta steineri]|uniref:Uncharacterized protein n=1 Tax=Adineta steineri TaxID=433720 RepID=A0A815RYF1_9BILA|nr:unnamed protein product [Adineta steineri]CAF1484650.1 unnamed protein product [Adineta steineri]CAF3997322.1 unnamed protein product [Adineta steineri]CAF4038576.1 unnamed protein product [Adineta steineri]